jgi:hypothetical protein
MNPTIRRLLLIVFLMILIEGIFVGAIFFNPDFRQQAGESGAAWFGDDETEGYAGRLNEGIGSWFRNWVVPLWTTAEPEQTVEPAFAKCGSCHTDYSLQSKFGDLYMDHTAHEQIGLDCGTCHTDLAHPDPLPPLEDVCADCHEDVATGGDCTLCHAPASIPHYSIFGANRVGLVDCGTCHLPGTLTGSNPHPLVEDLAFDGNDHELCLTCHQERSCQQCHSAEHPPEWVDVHGASVGPRGPIECSTCHTLKFCADACHAGRAGTHPLPIERYTGGNE